MYIKKKHLINVGKLRACNEIIWPYPKIKYLEDFDDDIVIDDELMHLFDARQKFKDLSMEGLEVKDMIENNDMSIMMRNQNSTIRRRGVRSNTKLMNLTMQEKNHLSEGAFFVKHLVGMVSKYMNA
mmetsp:Transcript_36373/g.32640  ORF Transcript_36373/g.32640 Transcript_36373/m.32640 type:complete len:126 (-) Transcript_36373:943-1320(-)